MPGSPRWQYRHAGFFEVDAVRLTVLSDYALRVLMFLGTAPGRLVTIREIAVAFGISENHLMKVVQKLAAAGFIETVRGRGGGMRLKEAATDISLGAVLRATEDDFDLVECFGAENVCRISRVCRLKGVLKEALQAYLAVLDGRTLADLVAEPRRLADRLRA